jgi:N-acetylneuraminic acid mutarotase
MDYRNRIIAGALLILTPCQEEKTASGISLSDSPGKKYEWVQLLPFGNGSHQLEWKPGTFPMGLKPLLGFEDKLWITGQKATWSSADGTHWVRHIKKDWGERISIAPVFFDNKLWMYGGMQYQERKLLNEVWFTTDGSSWEQAENAAWQPRKGHAVVVFKDKLWLFGGVTNVSGDFVPLETKNDIWSSDDGLNWKKEIDHAPWSPRDEADVLVMRDTLYLLGGQELGDVWRSADGKSWTQLTPGAAWERRSDKGALVFDDMLWVFGGRDTLANHHLAAQNDVWFSRNGINWVQQAEHAPWTVRSGVNSVVFKDQLLLFSGKHTGGNPVWRGDIWALKKRTSH